MLRAEPTGRAERETRPVGWPCWTARIAVNPWRTRCASRARRRLQLAPRPHPLFARFPRPGADAARSGRPAPPRRARPGGVRPPCPARCASVSTGWRSRDQPICGQGAVRRGARPRARRRRDAATRHGRRARRAVQLGASARRIAVHAAGTAVLEARTSRRVAPVPLTLTRNPAASYEVSSNQTKKKLGKQKQSS